MTHVKGINECDAIQFHLMTESPFDKNGGFICLEFTMTGYEAELLREFEETLEANAGHLDSTGQALLRAIGRGSPELYAAVEKLLDRISGFGPSATDTIH